MLNFLIKIFIRDRENTAEPAVRLAYGRICGIWGIFLNVLLFAGKYFAGLISGSVAIMADAFNNLSDALSAFISLCGFVLSAKKPDRDHPFGHGRMEYLAGLLLSSLIMVMGFELLKSSLDKIREPAAIQAGLLPALILTASIAVKLYMALYNRHFGRKIHSAAMLAASADSLSDSASTLVVLLSMGISQFWGINIDGWAGLIVALFIMVTGFKSVLETVSPLLGKAPEEELVQSIEALALQCPEIAGIHDLMVHDYGPGRLMISLHAEVDGRKDVFTVHEAIDKTEKEINRCFGAVTTIHMDPK